MKKIVEINTTNYASTGNIMLNIAKEARKQGYKVYTCCKNANESQKYHYEDQIYIGNRIDRIISAELAYITGLRGHFNIVNTLSFINKLETIKPDLIHLHVLHDSFINLSMLFKYIKNNNIPVVWTFHDCWAFTGQCPYFDIVNCNKWMNSCHHCPQINLDEPKTLLLDTTKYMYKKKKKWFTGINNCHIITCSDWLKQLTAKSFFKDYHISVINNGINLDIFKPSNTDIRSKYNIKAKYIILGVANVWGKRKGLDVFVELANKLGNEYQIVLVGTNDKVDKILPNNIISIHRTYNKNELIDIYSSVDLFVNPTREENFPTVNIESLSCGTPVLTFNTGGSPEIIDEKTGVVVDKDNIDALIKEIIRICKDKPFKKRDCVDRAALFNSQDKFKEYINLYKKILKD